MKISEIEHQNTQPFKLGDMAIIRTNFPDADFWIARKGSRDTVGKPHKNFKAEDIGIKVKDQTQLLPSYLYYVFMHLYQQGVWKYMATGTLNLVNITVSDVKNLPIEQTK